MQGAVPTSSSTIYNLAAIDRPAESAFIAQTLMIHSSQYYYTSYVAVRNNGNIDPFYYIPGQATNQDNNSGHAYYGIVAYFVAS